MALTQEQVDWWFSQNPDATAEDVAAAVKSIGGLEANAGLAGMLANRFSIAEPDVTNYYNTYVGATTPTTSTTNTDAQTFTDNIINTPTTETDLFKTIGDGQPPVTQTTIYEPKLVDLGNGTFRTPGGNIIDSNGYPVTTTTPPADNITNSGLTGQAGQMVVEGDDIETQIAQLPQEYASWQTSSIPGYIDFIRKDDGAVLDRRQNNTFSDLDLLKIGLSFIPGAGQILAAINVADAARTGNWTQAAIGATGLVPGMQNVNTALRVGQAVDAGNGLGAITALAGNTDVQNLLGLGNVNVGGFTAKDAMTAAQLASAASSGNTAGVLTSLGTLAGSSDTVLAGRALGLITRIQNGDTRALGEAVNLSNSISGSTAGATTGSTTGANITTLSDEDLAELQPGELNAYQTGGVQGLADFRRDMRLLNSLTTSGRTGDDTGGDTTTTSTDISGLPIGLQLASTGDGVFRTDVGGVPTYAESSNASSVKAPLGYTLLSISESDEKPAGSYYDITANAWFKPDTAVTNLTGDANIQADVALFNNSLGTLDQLDTTRTADEFADFLASIGITNTTQLTDSGLSNQDILDLINATDDTVTVTDTTGGGTTSGNITDTTGLDTGPVIPNGNDGIPTVLVEACKDGKVRDPVTGQCVLPTTTVDTITGGDGNDGIPTVVVEACKDGKVRDPITGQCVLPDTIPEIVIEECKDGKVRDPVTGQCVMPEIVIEDCKDGKVRDPITGECVLPTVVVEDCKDGKVRDPVTGQCVLPTKTTLNCPDGYEPNEAGTECIAVLKVEECKDGKVRDPVTGECVLPKVEDEECETGYEKVNGTCVPVCKEGYIRNLETGVCEKAEKECPVGQVRNAEGKCVPIPKTTECQPGFEKVNGVCVPICQPGYVRIDGVCKKIPTEVITTMPISGPVDSGEKTDPIYAGGMDSFNLLATLQELLAEEPPKKDDKKSKDKTKMATGGHLDDLLAEQMTVDDLLKLLR